MTAHERERVVALDPEGWHACGMCREDMDKRTARHPRPASRWCSPNDVEGRLRWLEVVVEDGEEAEVLVYVHGSPMLTSGWSVEDHQRWKQGLPLRLGPGTHVPPLLATLLVRSPSHVVLDVVRGRVVSARVALSPLHL